MVNIQKPEAEIKDLQLVFIELPKFRAKRFSEKKLQILWLRFMSELDQTTRELPSELLEIKEIEEAAKLAEEAAYSPAELETYDRYWDSVSVERTLKSGFYGEGLKKGREEGREEGRAEGREEGREEGQVEGRKAAMREFAIQLLRGKIASNEKIAQLTGLPEGVIQNLADEYN